MARRFVSKRVRRLAVVAFVGLIVAGGAPAADAHPSRLALEIVSEQGTIAPDGRSMTFLIATTCDRRASVVTARVSAVQAQGSGEASFTPTCAQISYNVPVTVPALTGSFRTGNAQVSAVLIVQQGSSKEARATAPIRLRPSVSVVLADEAVLESGGQAVRIDVTVTCPPVSAGQGGEVNIYDGQVVGTGTFPPTACDGLPHTSSVRVATTGGVFQVGSAEAFAFGGIEEGGDFISSADFRTILIR
jgi:hypothetical protein